MSADLELCVCQARIARQLGIKIQSHQQGSGGKHRAVLVHVCLDGGASSEHYAGREVQRQISQKAVLGRAWTCPAPNSPASGVHQFLKQPVNLSTVTNCTFFLPSPPQFIICIKDQVSKKPAGITDQKRAGKSKSFPVSLQQLLCPDPGDYKGPVARVLPARNCL